MTPMKKYHALFILMLISGAVNAQQAKAYERVRFSAHLRGMVFHLNYADGYVGASTIKLKERKAVLVFRPESGSPDNDRSLRFAISGDPGRVILIKNVDETIEAPKKLSAIYQNNRQIQSLLFIRDR
jgi:hypothetical protein